MQENQPVGALEEAQSAEDFLIEVDMDLCKGHATCQGEASDLFHVDESGKLTVLKAIVSEGEVEKARLAAKYCPTQAIKIVKRGSV